MVTPERLERIKSVAANRRQDIIVVLEDIYDPHNAEAIFRTCEAFGVQQLYLISVKQAAFNAKGIGKSSSSSANKWLDFRWFFSIEECFSVLKDKGFTIVGTVLTESSQALNAISFDDSKIALVFGNESRGLSETAVNALDKQIKIPMKGMTQSLNISVAAAVCLQEITRQRSDKSLWQFSNDDQEILVTDLLDR